MGTILDLTKHKNFKPLMVHENFDDKNERKVRLLIWTDVDVPEYKKAIFKVISPLKIGIGDMDDSNQEMNISCDVYTKTGNYDTYNNNYEYIYSRTERD